MKIVLRMSLFLTIAVLLIAASMQAHAVALSCSDLFGRPQNQLQNLSRADLDQAIQNFAKMRIRLDLAKASGSASSVTVRLTSDLKKKEEELIEHFRAKGLLFREELATKIKLEIARLQAANGRSMVEEDGRKKEQKEKIAKRFLETIDGTRAVFNFVEPGSALMGVGDKKSMVTIDRPYEMMATPVTQIIWRRVAELADSRFPGAYHIDLNHNPSGFRGDTRPVESVSTKEIEVWIIALNDLSMSGEPELGKIIHGHKTGDVYRLPSNWEWEFVVRGRGTFNDQYSFGNDESLVSKYAWWGDNSGDETHPVAEKLPIRIGLTEFYDMHGNVYEWCADWHDDYPQAEVTNPTGPDEGKGRIIRGGNWSDFAESCTSAHRNGDDPGSRKDFIGFRVCLSLDWDTT